MCVCVCQMQRLSSLLGFHRPGRIIKQQHSSLFSLDDSNPKIFSHHGDPDSRCLYWADADCAHKLMCSDCADLAVVIAEHPRYDIQYDPSITPYKGEKI